MKRLAGVLPLALACRASTAPKPAPMTSGVPEIEHRRVLQNEGDLQLEEVTWRVGSETGKAWLASWPAEVRLRIAASETVVPFRDLLPTEGTWAAINGGFYESDRAMGLVVSGGAQVMPLSPRGGSGVIAGTPTGFDIIHRDAWAPGAANALQSIDRLVDGGTNLVAARQAATRTARSAVALGGGRSWLVALAGDRSIRRSPHGGFRLEATTGSGMSLHDFANFLISATQAEKALNLDGAVSTQLAVHGRRRFEVIGERGTINAVVVEAWEP